MLVSAEKLNFKLPKLSPHEKEYLCNYAEQVLTCQQQIINLTGQSILQYMLAENEVHFKNKHYPPGDRIDFKNGGQYFYHCHRENQVTDEHGHFHCYLRRTAIPKSFMPTYLPQKAIRESQQMTHIIAISLNRLGQPIRLFTLNHWVTREVAYAADLAENLTKRFKLNINNSEKWDIIDRWVEGIVHLFLPQIIYLQNLRDIKIKALAEQAAELDNISENPQIEEISSISIDLVEQVEWVIN